MILCGNSVKIFHKIHRLQIKREGIHLSFLQINECLSHSFQVGGGVVGLAISVPELIYNSVKLAQNNCVTKASQSLRNEAERIKTNSEQMREELDAIW